jgi:hypothetical protein
MAKKTKRAPLTAVLATFRRGDRPGWDDAWVGIFSPTDLVSPWA